MPRVTKNMPEFMNKLTHGRRHSVARGWLLVLFLIVVPLQMAWGAASAYCHHEGAAGAGHFGHHDHKAAAGHGKQTEDTKLKKIVEGDDNCLGCHLNAAQVLVDHLAPSSLVRASAPPGLDLPRYRSPVPPGLERPARVLAL